MKWDRISMRRILVWVAWAVVLVAGLTGLFAWHSARSYEEAVRGFETYVGSADHWDYSRAPVPDAENAVAAFRSAVSDVELNQWSRAPQPAAWSPATEASARDALADHAEAIDDLAAASELPSCVWQAATEVDADASFEVDADASLAAVKAARLIRLLGFVGVVDGDDGRIAAAYRILDTLAECLYAQPHLFGSITAAAVERFRLEVVQAALSSPETSDDLLETLKVELERSAAVDRVGWAIAAEGALGLRLLKKDLPGPASTGRRLLQAAFSKRVAAALASRWVELKSWSERPFEELLSETKLQGEPDLPVAGMVVDMMMPNLRSVIVTLRTNRALMELAISAIEARRYGRRQGGYAGVVDDRSGIEVLIEGNGSAVLIGKELESRLRAQLGSAGAGQTPGAESTLDLTVWRLPPPVRESSPGG
ncbi:MAG: hypothetical protein GY769_26170 [bacterium]|nr:hypothetical protein [bacterium]